MARAVRGHHSTRTSLINLLHVAFAKVVELWQEQQPTTDVKLHLFKLKAVRQLNDKVAGSIKAIIEAAL